MTTAFDFIAALREKARESLGSELAESSLVNPNEDEEAKAWSILVKLIERENRSKTVSGQGESLDENERTAVAQELFDHFFRLGPLQRYLEEDSVEEITINGKDRGFVLREDGSKEEFQPAFTSDNDIRLLLSRVVTRAGRRIDESSPAVDARLPDGSRLHAILPPLTESPCITIRRHRLRANSLAELVELGTATSEAASFLAAAVEEGLNILVSGGTGSGKTTTLNALGRAIPSEERVVTIEETGELRLKEFLPDCVPLEQRKANAEGVGEVSIRELVRHALRMRPNRLIVGEVRGPEALDMLSAMNTGHQGSMGTIHANSARQALSKLEIYMLSGGEPITSDLATRITAETINLIVHLKFVDRGQRTIAQIAEVTGIDGGRVLIDDLFRLEQGRLIRTSARSKTLGHIETASSNEIRYAPSFNGRGV